MATERHGARPLAVTLGDPAGIGPEIVACALAARPQTPVRVFGDASVLARAAGFMGVAVPPCEEVTRDVASRVTPGQPNDDAGAAQVAYLEAATADVLAGRSAALVTAPISKTWAARANFAFPGHTEFLAARAGHVAHAMMLAGPTLRVVLATTHIALADVPRRLTADRIAEVTVLAARALENMFGVARPRVAVAGLNPHAGEDGRFGDEEARLVAPALTDARARLAAENSDALVTGPHVPDVVFRQAAGGAFDAVVALYHDQGLIPLKLLHFDDAVNVTLGLPFVRTSPDHGTAYDVAGTGRARPHSFLAAFDLAARLAL